MGQFETVRKVLQDLANSYRNAITMAGNLHDCDQEKLDTSESLHYSLEMNDSSLHVQGRVLIRIRCYERVKLDKPLATNV